MSGISSESFKLRGFKSRLAVILSAAIFFIGVALRYYFICVTNRPSDPANILGDAEWYVLEAVNFFNRTASPTMYDTLFPPGAPFYFAILRIIDPSMRVLDLTQWVLASLLPLILGYTAYRLYGRKSALYVLLFSSLYFPLWEFFGFFISEGPFIFTLYLSFLLLILSIQAKSHRTALIWGLLGGLSLGASAACKSCALLSAAFVVAALIFGKRKEVFRLWPTFASALLGVAIVLIPVSIRATKLNEGRFLLIANDSPRTFLMGHEGRVGLTWWIDQKRDFRMNFSNPSANQHNYLLELTYPFGPYEPGPNYAAGFKWIKENPIEAFFLSCEHVLDMFAFVLPWPGYFLSYAPWTRFFNNLFMVLILLPATVYLVCSARQIWRRNPLNIGDTVIFSAGISIYVIAFLFLGEGRYRICYDGFMMMLASRAFFPKISDGARRFG